MGQCCMKEHDNYYNERNETPKKEIHLSLDKHYESDRSIRPSIQVEEDDHLKAAKSGARREEPTPFFSYPASNNDDPRTQLIIRALEIGSLLNINLTTEKGDRSAANLEITSLLLRVLNSMKGNNIQNQEDNSNLINHFLQSNEVELTDPLDFILYLLKLLNNDHDLNIEELPHYYMEDTKEIPEQVLIVKEEELKRITEENGIRKSIGLTTTVPYLQICTNPSCSKPLFVNVNCELEFYYTYIVNPSLTISENLNSNFSEIKMKASCVNCKKCIDDYRTRCRKTIVNYPEFLFIRVKEEKDEDLIDGANLKLTEISSLKIQVNTYELISVITKQKDNDYSCFKKIDGIFQDSKQFSVNNEGEFEKAFILLYSLSDNI